MFYLVLVVVLVKLWACRTLEIEWTVGNSHSMQQSRGAHTYLLDICTLFYVLGFFLLLILLLGLHSSLSLSWDFQCWVVKPISLVWLHVLLIKISKGKKEFCCPPFSINFPDCWFSLLLCTHASTYFASFHALVHLMFSYTIILRYMLNLMAVYSVNAVSSRECCTTGWGRVRDYYHWA